MTTDFDRLVRRARHLRDQRERPRVHPLDILIYGNESAADEALDQDEEYEAMAEERILKADPESLAFFNAVRQAQSSGRSPERTIRRR